MHPNSFPKGLDNQLQEPSGDQVSSDISDSSAKPLACRVRDRLELHHATGNGGPNRGKLRGNGRVEETRTGWSKQKVTGRTETGAPGSRGDPWDIAVVDPPRDGLGAAAVGALTACEPRAIAYVSCDPASLGRDSRLLAEAGYVLAWAAPVDMFPQTFHVETVAAFRRSDALEQTTPEEAAA